MNSLYIKMFTLSNAVKIMVLANLILMILWIKIKITLANWPKKTTLYQIWSNFYWKYIFSWIYSGFIVVDNFTNLNLFYWFYREKNLDANSPFVIWVNGDTRAWYQLENLLKNESLRIVIDDSGDLNVRFLSEKLLLSI